MQKTRERSDLAGALSNFLPEWISKRHVSKQRNHRQTNDMSLGRVVLDIWQQCMNNGKSNAEVAATIGKNFNTHDTEVSKNRGLP